MVVTPSLGSILLASTEPTRLRAWYRAAFHAEPDPDGNCIQVIELSPAYYAARGRGLLARADAAARLPAQDLHRARTWYADKLDLHPHEERPGGLRYRCGTTTFSLFASAGRPSGGHTQLAWSVDDFKLA